MIGLFKLPLLSKIALLIKSFKSRVTTDNGTFEAESCLKTNLTQVNNANVLQQASLVITPNAVKAGKLYSIVPTNGAGDLDVVRATTGTRVNSDGLIEIVPYNLLQQSEGFTVSPWVLLATPNITRTANAGTSPIGTNNATLLTSNSNDPSIGIRQNVVLSTNTPYVFSLWARSDNGARIQLDISDNGATFFNLTTEWQRIQVTGQYWELYGPTDQFVDITFDVNQLGKTCLIWGAQLEIGTQTKEYFPVTNRFNIPRLDYTNASCPSILVEPQRTNLCLQSEMFTQSPWTGNAIISANTNIAPNGTLTADTLSDNSTTVRHQISQDFNVSTNTAYTTSVFIKKTTGTLSHYPALQIFYSGVANRIIAIILNTTTGTFNFLASGVSPVNSYSAVVKNYQDYWRVEFTTIDNQSNNNLSVSLLPAFSQDGTTTSIVATGSNVFWGAQLEAGSNATSYIPTTTSSVTRNADVISKTGISSLIGQTEGSIYCEIDNIAFNSNAGIFVLQNNENQFENRIGFRYSNFPVGALNAFIRSGPSNVVSLNGEVNIVGKKYKMCFTYNQTEQKFFINGVLVSSRTGSYAQPNTLDQAQLGSMANNSFPSVIGIKSALIFTTLLTDQQAIQLTTL